MKNNFYLINLYLIISFFLFSNLNSEETFIFNVSEIEITENGNIFKGKNGGEAYTNDGISIIAKNFEYNKAKQHLKAINNVKLKDNSKNLTIEANEISYFKNQEIILANGEVIIEDKIKNIKIFADKIKYNKINEIILSENNIKLIDYQKNLTIKADKINVFKKKDKVFAEGNVDYIDETNNIKISTDKITYLKNFEKIFTEGQTIADIHSKYKFMSKNVTYDNKYRELGSLEKTIIHDKKFVQYELDNFNYEIDKEFLKGKNIKIIENSQSPLNETNIYFFADGFFDLKNKSFLTGETKISLKKNIFDRSENDPRLFGVSSNHQNEITTIKKAVFTSCSKDNDCPPWQLEASEIKHDKKKKQLIYENSILKVYNFPVFYFPKFFHPDPTVDRQSGFLVPKLNNSNILGSSINVPYFHIISENKDFTIAPTIFSKNTIMMQNEYRQENKDSSIIADFGFVNNFKSSETNKTKNISHLFANFKKNLNLKSFLNSDLNIFIEKVTKDTYLKIFSDNMYNNKIRPKNIDVLNTGFEIFLDSNKFSLSGGANIYEDLTKLHSDRYQYVLPYYNYSQNSLSNKHGTFGLMSRGNNIIDNTNNVKSRIINDFNFKLNDKIFEKLGLRSNLNFYFKNLNSIGKNVDTYKSSPQIELQSLIEINSGLPMMKESRNSIETLLPKLSLRINPGDMKNHSTDERKITPGNIFNINRLGINDSLESGNSLTLGIDYKKENKTYNDKYLEFKLATLFRDGEEKNIPTQTTLDQKNSNIFGSVDYSLSKYVNIDYDFAIDNKIDNFKYNSIGIDFNLNNFVTEFKFIEEDSDLGNTNVFENTTSFNINEKNSIIFKTRRNREINITEYYNLVYEYNNDCLTAGVRFNKSYYEDRDLKPSENLMFTISFFPLTTIEQTVK